MQHLRGLGCPPHRPGRRRESAPVAAGYCRRPKGLRAAARCRCVLALARGGCSRADLRYSRSSARVAAATGVGTSLPAGPQRIRTRCESGPRAARLFGGLPADRRAASPVPLQARLADGARSRHRSVLFAQSGAELRVTAATAERCTKRHQIFSLGLDAQQRRRAGRLPLLQVQSALFARSGQQSTSIKQCVATTAL